MRLRGRFERITEKICDGIMCCSSQKLFKLLTIHQSINKKVYYVTFNWEPKVENLYSSKHIFNRY